MKAKSNQHSAILDTIEEAALNEIVFDKLGVNIFEYEVISGISSVNRYVLVEGNGCYLIYDRKIMDYIEYSTSTNSIYYSTEENIEKVYLAPTYYFKLKNNKIIDLINKKEVTPTEIESFVTMEEQLYLNFVESRKNVELLVENENLIMSTGPSEPTYITHSYYFEKLADNMGYNTTTQFTGSCSYVAIGMILSYYDSIVNDNVIEESYDVEELKHFSSYSSINTNSYSESPGIDNTFHADIIALGREKGYTASDEFSISYSEMSDLLNDYFSDSGISITTHNTNIITNKINFCKEAINSDNPVIIKITGTDPALDSRDLNHSVVGYGYDDSGIYVNFGWTGTYRNVNINNYTISSAFYLELNEEHQCSNNYLWNYNSCTGTVCSCGLKTCNHEMKSFYNYNYTYHKERCTACGTYSLKTHNFYISGEYNICLDCGYQIEINHIHTYSYEPHGDGRFHTASCSCGDVKRESCIGMVLENGDTCCIKCGQEMTSGGLIPLNSLDETCDIDKIKCFITNK